MTFDVCNVEVVDEIPEYFTVARIVPGGRKSRLQWLVPGADYKVPRREGPLTLYQCAMDYIGEHCISAGVDERRAWAALEDWIDALGADKQVATLTRADGRAVVKRVEDRGCSTATARRILTFGIAALNHARKEERLGKDKVLPAFQMPARSEPRVRWLSREEQRRLMQAPKSPRLHRFFVLAFATGARSEAICELEWKQVDFVNRTINFAKEGIAYKNKRRALVPISDDLYPRLLSMYERRADDYVIGLSARGKCNSTYNEAKKVLRAIGIDEVGVARHVARHTFASWLLQNGVSIYEVAKLIGDTVGMVERVYGHMLPKHLLGAVNKLH